MSISQWETTADILAHDSLGLREGEKVLLIVGEGIEELPKLNDIYLALKAEIIRSGCELCTIRYYADPAGKIPDLIETACGGADVIITVYTRGLIHSEMYPRIQKQQRKNNARLLMLPNSDNHDFLDRMMPKTRERFYEVADMTEKIGRLFLGAPHRIRVTADNGTDISFSIGKLTGWAISGLCSQPGDSSLSPAGNFALGIDEGSAEGTLVIDCYTALKPTLLEDAIVFHVHHGYAEQITGGKEAKFFLEAAAGYPGTDAQKFNIAEFGLGFDRVADVEISPTEGEHIYAGAHFGIGSNVAFGGAVMIPAWHKDCILPGAAVEVDGVLIARDGEYLV